MRPRGCQETAGYSKCASDFNNFLFFNKFRPFADLDLAKLRDLYCRDARQAGSAIKLTWDGLMNDRSQLRIAMVGVLLTGSIAVPAPPAVAQAQEQQIYISVLDQNERMVADLTVDDFIVREDGVLREVLRVQRATNPMQVALLVDNSAASAPYLRDLRDGLGEFVKRIGGSDHEVAVITFGDRPTIVEEYTWSVIALQQAVGKIFPRPGGGSLLLDAIYDAGRGLQLRAAARPVIVAVTTEGVEYSNRPYQAVLRTIRNAGATFHAVVMTASGPSFDNGRSGQGSRFRDIVLERGTTQTGGRLIRLQAGQFFRESMEAVAEELLSQYLLVYARPEMLVPPEKFELLTTRPSLTVRGRSVGAAQ